MHENQEGTGKWEAEYCESLKKKETMAMLVSDRKAERKGSSLWTGKDKGRCQRFFSEELIP
jgi:hypothetical protein